MTNPHLPIQSLAMNAVSLEDVSKSFGNILAVDGLSVNIPVGCIYGFLGPNGAGKTTSIRMIMNIIRPDSGAIEVLGESSVESAKNRIGYMPEERGLYRKMTVRKVLTYFGAIKGLKHDELARAVPLWLRRVDLENWADKKVEELSRGMHQKLQFAVTIINNPELVILDEPFSGLDPLNQDLLKEIISQMRNEGRTVIFSTHVMSEAEKLCDYILLINKGKAVLDDRLKKIRSQYSSQVVRVEIQGDTSFVETMPMVESVKSDGGLLEVTLANGDTQRFIRELVRRVNVTSFEIKVPTLHEIFIKLVGADNAENS